MTDSVLTVSPPAAVREARRVRIVTLAVAGGLVTGAVVFHRPLIAWFGGTPLASGAPAPGAQVTAGGLSIETAVQPDPPIASGDRAHITLRDASGKPVAGAKVRLEFDMPAMGAMQAMHGGADATEDGGGHYTAPFDLGMDGSWTVSIKVSSPAGAASARYTLRTGSPGLTPLGGEASADAKGDAPAYYTCSMHTTVHSATPGKCPICSMDLVPVTTEHAHPGTIRIDDQRRALLGIRTAKVMKQPIDLEIAAKGRLTFDETRLHEITLKVGGYVSDLRVNASGQTVRRGDVLFTLYSPELYAAEQEYLIARQNADVMRAAHNAAPGAADRAAAPGAAGNAARDDLLSRAAETKLRLWDFGDDQLRAIAQSGTPIERVPFRSPASGVVIEKNLVEGAAVMAGQRLFRIADLDQIWVEADVYEADLPRITKDLLATITLSYLPGKTFEGKVAFVYPYLDPASRTGRVRIALPNKGLELKPDMYATATFKIPLGPRLTVPTSAVIYTGPRRLVFVDAGDGALSPREVTIGARTGDRVEIASGLDEGDVVISSGNFLVAAESRVRSAASFWEDSHAEH